MGMHPDNTGQLYGPDGPVFDGCAAWGCGLADADPPVASGHGGAHGRLRVPRRRRPVAREPLRCNAAPRERGRPHEPGGLTCVRAADRHTGGGGSHPHLHPRF